MSQGNREDRIEHRSWVRRLAARTRPALWMAIGAVLVWTGRASSQVGGSCPDILPAPLVTFCAGDPARASDMNGNFDTVVDWIEDKVGPVSSGDVTMHGDVTMLGDVSVPIGTFTGIEISDGTISGTDISDGSLRVADLDNAEVRAWLRDQFRTYVRTECEIQIGWTDGCDWCGENPGRVSPPTRPDGTCTGAVDGTGCAGGWSWLNTDGDVNGDDVFYVRMQCD